MGLAYGGTESAIDQLPQVKDVPRSVGLFTWI